MDILQMQRIFPSNDIPAMQPMYMESNPYYNQGSIPYGANEDVNLMLEGALMDTSMNPSFLGSVDYFQQPTSPLTPELDNTASLSSFFSSPSNLSDGATTPTDDTLADQLFSVPLLAKPPSLSLPTESLPPQVVPLPYANTRKRGRKNSNQTSAAAPASTAKNCAASLQPDEDKKYHFQSSTGFEELQRPPNMFDDDEDEDGKDKKKRRPIKGGNKLVGVGELTRDQLVEMSSKDLDDYASTIGRALTEEEEKTLKRHRRLIKNRESAQLSRQRKKIYVENLEKRVSQLTNQNESLIKQLNRIQAQNEELKDEVKSLKQQVNGGEHHHHSSHHGSHPKSAKMAGVCLLVMLFSFGLFLNGTSNGGLPALSWNENVAAADSFNGRVLLSMDNKADNSVTVGPYENINAKTLSIKQSPPPADIHTADKTQSEDNNSMAKRKRDEMSGKGESGVKDKSRKKPVMVVEDHEEDGYIVETKKMKNDGLALVQSSSSSSSSSNHRVFVNSLPPPEDGATSFIYCSTAHQILPDNYNENNIPSYPPVISLLLPSAVLNGTIPNIDMLDQQHTILEVSAQILNVQIFPYQPRNSWNEETITAVNDKNNTENNGNSSNDPTRPEPNNDAVIIN